MMTQSQQRTFQVDDLFRLEQIGRYFGGPFAFSPDGKTFAYVLQRAKATTKIHKQDFLWGNDRADVWLADLDGDGAVNLTQGEEDDSGFWAPTWSADGKYLAMLSTRYENVHLWVWTQETGQLRQLTSRGVDLQEILKRPYQWFSSEQIVCPVLAEGEKPWVMTIEMRAAQIAMEAWPKAWRGEDVTASVLQSGVSVDPSQRPQGQLWLINVNTGIHQVLTTGTTQSVTISPDKQTIAFLKVVGSYQPEADVPLSYGTFHQRRRLQIALPSENKMTLIEPDAELDVLEGSLCWSTDSRTLAFIASAEGRQKAPRIYRFVPEDGTLQLLGSRRLDPTPLTWQDPKLHWSAQGDLLVYAAQLDGADHADAEARRDWWVVTSEGGVPLTTDLEKPPTDLLAVHDTAAFVGLAMGNLWRIQPDAEPENITDTHEIELTQIVWPAARMADNAQITDMSSGFNQIIAGAQAGNHETYHRVDLTTGQFVALSKPVPEAKLVGYSPYQQRTLFSASTETGSFLWSTQLERKTKRLLLETNTFLSTIKAGAFQQIEYRSLNGEILKGWLILPPDYREGQTYPLVTWVYPGIVWGDSTRGIDGINHLSTLNLQILAAHGYVVLNPSMPLQSQRGVDDPMLRLMDGVLPAVERAIELGIADPERLFVMGQSFGGYATYGLLTQTHRFKAAVALAGISNPISLYGAFDARSRYDDYANENLFSITWLETGQMQLGNPPWKDLGRYMRNSPIFGVDRVETPLMIIQGDMDYISLQQGEEFFMGLYRQGKRAEFVRYWGEGHVLEGPANIRDMWQRIIAWLEEFSARKIEP